MSLTSRVIAHFHTQGERSAAFDFSSRFYVGSRPDFQHHDAA